MEKYLSEIIAGIALLFSIYTQAKQNKAKTRLEKNEREIEALRLEVFKKQSEINDFILEKEKKVEIHVFNRKISESSREIVFHNVGSVNAEAFNVEFNIESNGRARWSSIPKLPTTLLRETEISFRYAMSIATEGVMGIEMSWINPRTGEIEHEKKELNLR